MRIGLAVLALLVAAAVPSAVAAPELNPAKLIKQLEEAIELEDDANDALWVRHRKAAARALIERSLSELREIERALGSHPAAKTVSEAIEADENLLNELNSSYGVEDRFWDFELERALAAKDKAKAQLAEQPLNQCTDGKDNDGDKMRDARFDSGCTSSKDGTERSALTCSLETMPSGETATIKGTCSGPFEEVQILAPSGVRFDRMPVPPMAGAERCRFASPERFVCSMEDGMESPSHAFRVRLGLTGPASAFRVRIADFAGRVRAQTVKPAQPLRLRLRYYHFPLTHVCALFEASAEGSVDWSATGPNGFSNSGTVELRQTAQGKAAGEASFRIFQLGTYEVTGSATIGGESVMTTQTIAVGNDPGDPGCN